jgi:hypothetical protein
MCSVNLYELSYVSLCRPLHVAHTLSLRGWIIDGGISRVFRFPFLLYEGQEAVSNRWFEFRAILAGVAFVVCTPLGASAQPASPTNISRAGPGDTVISFELRRPLPNIFGKPDIFGRTIAAGRITVRYLGAEGSRAVFERSDITISDDATTMSRTPLFIPQTTTTHVYGSVGGESMSGTATSNSLQVIGPRPSTQYATTERPIRIVLGSGESVVVQGTVLRVIRVPPGSVDYVIE